jgi:hypothetical protein
MLESRQLSWPAYLVSLALITVPLSDAWTTLYPWRFLDPRWRFGAVGLVSNALLLPMVGLLLAYVTASALNHQRMRRIIAILSLASAAVCAGAIVVFGLDALQTRASFRTEMRLSFAVASIAAAMKTAMAAATLLTIGIAARRSSTSRPADARRDVPLFIGERSAAPSRSTGSSI